MAYSPSPKTVSILITAAQLKSLSQGPLTLVPAPGTGKYIVPLSASYIFHPGATPYTDGFLASYAVYLFNASNNPVLGGAQGSVKVANVSIAASSLGITTQVPLVFSPTPAQIVSPTNVHRGVVENSPAVFASIGGTSPLGATVLAGTPTALTVASGGKGYVVNDVLTLANQFVGFLSQVQATVTSVDGNGAVLAASPVNGVHYRPTCIPGKFISCSGGTGTGCYLNITGIAGSLYGIAASNVHVGAAGTGYNIGDTGTVQTGTISATYVVDTVSAGAVATYHFTSVGAGYIIANAVATSSTSGAGSGFQIDITGLGGGYAPGDTGTVLGGTSAATYTINTVDGNGNVLTYTLNTPGTVYAPFQGFATAVGGAQPGKGFGFYLVSTNPANDPTLGDGTMEVNFTYAIHQLP